MRVLVLGASGGTGLQTVSQALDRGYQVTAFVRDPNRLATHHERLRVVVGLADDPAAMSQAVAEQNVVISALGTSASLKANGLLEHAVPVILSAMAAANVRRLIFTSAIGVAESFQDAPLFAKVLIRILLKDIYPDKAVAERLIRQSDLDWTIVQPATLTNGKRTGQYRVGEHLQQPGLARISRADLADFMLRQIDEASYIRKIVRLGY